jgi:predicted peptidase
MSLGGFGTMDVCGTYPDRIAAGIALCGGTSLKDVSGLGKLPFWIIHGTADRAVPIRQSKEVVEKLQDSHNDSRLRYEWLEGGNHGTPARIFYLKKTYEWLFSHSLVG